LALAPTRVSAWMNLGLVAQAQGQLIEVGDIYQRLRAKLPQLVADVERDAGVAVGGAAQTSEAMAATFELVLRAMRGNRGSNRITYFLNDGRARLLPTRSL
jgi:hypothetical protein